MQPPARRPNSNSSHKANRRVAIVTGVFANRVHAGRGLPCYRTDDPVPARYRTHWAGFNWLCDRAIPLCVTPVLAMIFPSGSR